MHEKIGPVGFEPTTKRLRVFCATTAPRAYMVIILFSFIVAVVAALPSSPRKILNLPRRQSATAYIIFNFQFLWRWELYLPPLPSSLRKILNLPRRQSTTAYIIFNFQFLWRWELYLPPLPSSACEDT